MVSKLIEILKQNEVIYLPSKILMEYENNNLSGKLYTYPGFDGFQDLLHLTFYSKNGFDKGWNEYFFAVLDFSIEVPKLIFVTYFHGLVPINHKNPHSSLRNRAKNFKLIFHHKLGTLNLTISQPLRDFFHNCSTLYLSDFLHWFAFEYKMMSNSERNRIIGYDAQNSGLSVVGKIESFSSAFYFLKKHGFIKELNDEDEKLSHATSRSYGGELFIKDRVEEALIIGVSYSYYQGDNPRDGHASFKINFSDLQNIRECYKKSYGMESNDKNELPF